MLEANALEARFTALHGFLSAHEELWKIRPFNHLRLPWEAQYPVLAQWLRVRSLEDAEAAALQPVDTSAPAPLPALAVQAALLGEPGELPSACLPPAPGRLERDVPGRKWRQVEAFGQHLGFEQPVTHWVDWCGGKGHLGRRLVQPGQALDCLEFDSALISTGQALSDHHRMTATHRLQDVMASDVPLLAMQTPVALHACGDLHVQLLRMAADRGCRQLAVAPCCYNRTATTCYAPLSRAGQNRPLALNRDDLGLPASEAVTAGARERQQRDTSMARRLGFDLLQRQVRRVDAYLPTPSLSPHWLKATFANYCLHLGALKGVALSPDEDWDRWEALGRQRLAEVRNLERLRNLFRRPLELWLVLDRALFLQEHGYNVRVGTFCTRELTPRNLMMVAETAT